MTILTLLNVGYDDVVRMSTICSEAANDCPHHNGGLIPRSIQSVLLCRKQFLLTHQSRLSLTQLSALACLSRPDEEVSIWERCVTSVKQRLRGYVQSMFPVPMCEHKG